MIRLGKDKPDKRYNISDEGIITDLNGNVQELKIAKGRSYFKSVVVHKIQMWTNFGWRDGKVWAIHHLDENKLNNSLSNLVYLTRSEHIRLHNKGNKKHLGFHHSEESKKKISESMKGKHWNLSEKTKKRMSKSRKGLNTWTKGLRWFNDGLKNYLCKECPPGCVEGRIKWKN